MIRADCHIHTNYSDGVNTPEEMIQAAIDLGYSTIALTDHVRRTTAWLPQYVSHLRELRENYRDRIDILIGIEAKVLDLKGDIDADKSFDHQVDLILGSIHRIPNRDGFYSLSKGIVDVPEAIFAHWYTAFCRMIENSRVDVIAHPMAELRGFRIQPTTSQKRNIVEQVKASNKIFEINVRYEAPDEEMIEMVCGSGIPVIVSSDSHSIQDLCRYSKKITQLIQRDGLNIADMKQYIQHRSKLRKNES